jgi:hypothetical protein
MEPVQRSDSASRRSNRPHNRPDYANRVNRNCYGQLDREDLENVAYHLRKFARRR